MKEQLEKERIYLFSPFAVTVTRVEIEGILFIEKLQEAVSLAVQKNELLNARVALYENGEAYYETQIFDSNPNDEIRVYQNLYWKDLVKEQEKNAFDLDHGELVRFFLLQNDDKQELVVIAHRLLGDGASIAFLIEDIMCALSDQKLTAKPYKKSIAADTEGKLPFMRKIQENRIRSHWQKEGTTFDQEEYYKLYADFWQKNSSYIQYETFYAAALLRIAAYAKQEKVSIGAVILTAFAKASRELRHVQAAESMDERVIKASEQADLKELQKHLHPESIYVEISSNREYKGIGDYAVKKKASYLYEEDLPFAENAKKLDALLKQSPNVEESNMIARFPKSLTDSIYFELSGLYMSPDTEWLMNELGITQDRACLAVTNLAKVPIPVKYKNLLLKNYVYVPPMHPGARRALGITIFGNAMNICLHVKEDEYLQNARLFFQKGIAVLRKL